MYLCLILEGIELKKDQFIPEIFETHIPSELVYMLDNNIQSCGWLCVSGLPALNKTTLTDIELTAIKLVLEPNPPIPMAPYIVMSYDIESQPHVVPGKRETEFPKPTLDPILCIGVCLFDMVKQDIKQYCFMWEPKGSQCDKYPALSQEDQTDDYRPEHTVVYSFRNEYEMLKAFQKFIQTENPDIITGYNILNFDNVYTIQRAQHLQNSDESAIQWGRLKDHECRLKKQYKFSNQKGGKESWECSMEGREFLDLYKVIMDDHKLRSYKLDEVAAHFLGTRKIHIAYDDIPNMQKTPEGRIKLGIYCVKDAWIPCKIAIKMAKVLNAVLMSQVTGVSLNTILNRGQQIQP